MHSETMTLQEMKERKRKLKLTNQDLSERSGIPLSTVQKIFAGVSKAPRWDTREALAKVLLNADAARSYEDSESIAEGFETGLCAGPGEIPVRGRFPTPEQLPHGHILEERLTLYQSNKEQGSFTAEDYFALPDDCTVELIDGYYYNLASTLPIHQAVLRELVFQFLLCLENHPLCELFFAPSDVELFNQKTVVQPDLYIYCNRKKINKKINSGPPDFIAEILSPSNRYHDMFRKLNLYRFAHVREYWIVDPEKRKVSVYDLEHDEPPLVYSFEDTIPVTISNGSCLIDFAKISKKVEAYF